MTRTIAAEEPHTRPVATSRTPGTRPRLLLVSSHVVQYASPMYREIVRDGRLDIVVAYCSLQGAQTGTDPGFGVEVTWDIPLLEGYPWVAVPNRSLRPRLGSFFGLFNPGLWRLIRDGNFDAVYVSGYFYASAWIAILAAKRHRVPVLFTTEAHSMRSWMAQSRWTIAFKKFLVRRILSLGEILLTVSTGAAMQLRRLGFSSERVVLTPYTVDNAWWSRRAEQADKDAVRAAWKISPEASVVLFCAKLQPWKAPQDLLQAFAQANVPNLFLVFAGEGPLRAHLERLAYMLGIRGRVRFLGFVNQSQLPSVYRAADLQVLPSLYEPFGLVVNEGMLCGLPAAVSDRVGAKFDLIREGENGYVFPAGNVGVIATILRDFFSDSNKRARMSAAARERMKTWSPLEYVEGLVQAVELAARARR